MHAQAFAAAIETSADPELRAMALWPSLTPLRLLGQLAEHEAAAQALAEQTREHPEWGIELWASTHVGALWELGLGGALHGSLPRAREQLERGIEIARKIGDVESESWVCSAQVHVACLAGEIERGRATVQRAFELAEQLGTAMARVMAQTALAELSLVSGQIDAAFDAIDSTTAVAGADAPRLLLANQLRVRGQIARGEAADARVEAEAALASLLEQGVRTEAAEMAISLATALRLEGAEGAAPRAEVALATAERLIAETGARNLTPLVLLERASRLADADPARRALLERAREAFAEMGATGRVREVAKLLGT